LFRSAYQQMSNHLSLAREIDPRSPAVLAALIRSEVYLGQTGKARGHADELMALLPSDLNDIQWAVMAYIADGDLEGARRLTQQALAWQAETELVAYFAGYQETAYVLTDKQRELLYRLTPAAFDHDVAWWGQALSTAAWQQGDPERARAYADSSLEVAFAQIRNSDDDAQLRILNAASLAYAGRRADALREAERAMADTTGGSTDDTSYVLHQF